MSIIKNFDTQKTGELIHRPDINDEKKENLCYMMFDKHRYFWNTCDLIYEEIGKSDIDYWDDVKYLDYKITTSMFDDKKSYNCLENFLTNRQDEKILHIVNTTHEEKSLFEFDEWTTLCKIINKLPTEYLTIEVVNKTYWSTNYTINLEYEIEKCKELYNCYRLEFFLYFKKKNFFHIPLRFDGANLASTLTSLPQQEYKKYVEN